MPASDLSLLIDAAREAGEIATRYTGESAKRWDKPGGLGPVTEADMAVNDMLERDLRAARPGYGWLSEETEDGAGRLGREHVFIIDPIDGTRSFIEGSATWAHSLAVAEKGIVTAAVIYLPLRDKLYAAAKGQGASLNGAPITVSARDRLPGAHFMAAKPNLDAKNWKGGRVPDVRRSHRPSLAYRLSLVAEGRYDAMLTLRRSWEWDIAAGDLILREAGAVTSDRTGQPLRFNNTEPLLNGVVAANPALHRDILKALA
ncbi:3'(2'),5'-bisphosphate nucleotidase CysQ [uncultured Roseovarius sp.]|uniref:inositol monophosphatase family protein n=1 Tax=uncultured Roseovarius sp. TaxID=293344 RepID=UPI0025CEA637|nr:3'(2'),5'-bisphosphate nucleotidase CysQ [uncultured Roseovarius sp.]